MYNLLSEPLIRYRQSGGATLHASLPEVYAALMADEVEAFPDLRPHQRHAWHAFLVQLGAMAMHRDGLDTPPPDAGEWRRIIRALTPEWPNDEPWQLVVDDITQPAFMQPPASSEERWKDFKNTVLTPDDLDIISTSKNHDIKSSVLSDGEAGDWIFALTNLQTMAGQIGNGHYPISRMQSGWNSRTSFTLTSSVRWGKHVKRDMEALLKVDFSFWPMQWEGIRLLWTIKWDGNDSEALTLNRLHPYFLEVCRRRRLAIGPNGVYARVATAKQRLATKSSLGVVGDPWQLVDKRDKKGNKALAMQKDSFTYRRIVNYLFDGGDWDLPVLFSSSNEDRFLVARGVKGDRGGQTEGYYERIIHLRERVIQVYRRAGATQEIADIARERVAQVGKVQNILRHAIVTFATWNNNSRTNAVLRSRPDDNPLRKKVEEWLNRLDEIVDATFFDALQDEFEADAADRPGIRHRWLLDNERRSGVINHARTLLHDAEDSLPCPSIYHYKAREAAEGLFEGRIQGANGFPDLFMDRDEEAQE